MQKRFLFMTQALIFSQFREKEFKTLKFETKEKKKFKTLLWRSGKTKKISMSRFHQDFVLIFCLFLK